MAYEMILAPVTVANARNSEAATIELDDGRILLVWSDFYGGPTDFSAGRLSGTISADRGRTWSEKFTVVENTAVINTILPSLLRLQSGELALFYLKEENLGDSRMFIRKSHDEGETWGAEVCVTSDVAYHSPANDRVIQLRNGRILLPDGVRKTIFPDGGEYRLRGYYSDDNGETWHQGRGDAEVPTGGAEPVVVERRDGSVLMLIRTPLMHIYRCESFDGGDTWTVPVPTSLLAPASPSNCKRIPGTGDLLLIWNHSSEGHMRNPLTAAISKDDGETWSSFRDLENDPRHPCAYPSIMFFGDEVLLTYYRCKYTTPKVDPRGWELKLKILPVSWFYE